MKNPWLNIPAQDYEGHMNLPEVKQLSFLSDVFKSSLSKYDNSSIAYLGCATGNGLEHIDKEKTNTLTAIDINAEYLELLRSRYQEDIPNLKTINADLNDFQGTGQNYSLIFAGLLFEYLPVESLLSKISSWLEKAGVLVVLLQLEGKNTKKVSESPYVSLKQLEPIMNLVSVNDFKLIAKANGLKEIGGNRMVLESGKRFYIGTYKKERITI